MKYLQDNKDKSSSLNGYLKWRLANQLCDMVDIRLNKPGHSFSSNLQLLLHRRLYIDLGCLQDQVYNML